VVLAVTSSIPVTRRTKIVCTLGPAVDSRAKIKALFDAGMNVARINCSHGDWETRRQWIKWIQELQPKLAPIGILADLQGPKLRIGDVPGGRTHVKEGATFTFARKGTRYATIPDPKLWKAIKVGDRLLLGDGEVELKVQHKRANAIECRAVCSGNIRTRQGLTIVGKSFDVPPLTEKDKKDLKEAIRAGVDFVALSYVRSAKDIALLRRAMGHSGAKAVAKIETRDALEDIERIVSVADVVMVARGDLGLQMSLDEVPIAQKRIIAVCNAGAKPVITATQMLESMLHAPRPTRAEASDVANAILDGTDAVMLSGETAMGEYPIQAVKVMAAIAQKTDPLIAGTANGPSLLHDIETDSVALAAVDIATVLGTRAILTSSTSGMTPRLVSRYRPDAAVYCVAWNPQTQRQLSVVWGVQAATAKLPKGTDAAVRATIDTFRRLKRVKKGEKVVVTAGVPAGVPGNTNMILVLDV
jgi:pyruvate kinase